MESDGRLTRGMLFGNFANKLDGNPPHPPSYRLLVIGPGQIAAVVSIINGIEDKSTIYQCRT